MSLKNENNKTLQTNKIYNFKKKDREKLNDIGFGNDFQDVIFKVQATREKQRSWITSKVKGFVHQRKRQPIGENIYKSSL